MENFQNRGYKTYRADSSLRFSDNPINISVGRRYGLILAVGLIATLIIFVFYFFNKEEIRKIDSVIGVEWDDIQTSCSIFGAFMLLFIGSAIICSADKHLSNTQFLPKSLNVIKYSLAAIFFGLPFGWVIGVVTHEPTLKAIDNLAPICKNEIAYNPYFDGKKISSISGYGYFNGQLWGEFEINAHVPNKYLKTDYSDYHFGYDNSNKGAFFNIKDFYKKGYYLLRIGDSEKWRKLYFNKEDRNSSYSFCQDLIDKLSACDNFTIRVETPEGTFDFIFNGLSKTKP